MSSIRQPHLCRTFSLLFVSHIQLFSQHYRINKKKARIILETKEHVYFGSEHYILYLYGEHIKLSFGVSGLCVYVRACVHCELCSLTPLSHMSQTHRPLCMTAKLTHYTVQLPPQTHTHTHTQTNSHTIAYFIFATYIWFGLLGDCWKTTVVYELFEEVQCMFKCVFFVLILKRPAIPRIFSGQLVALSFIIQLYRQTWESK